MKAVLISIQPKWCELIASGKKTIEVRKTRPKIETPFKCYIYCTKQRNVSDEYWVNRNRHIYIDNGKVIGEFICDNIICSQAYYGNSGEKHLTNLFGVDIKDTCLSMQDIFDYVIGKDKKDGTGWLWHISDLKIYEKPKNFVFYKPCPKKLQNCPGCEFYSSYTGCCFNQVKRAPQSWCYVEELK